VTIKEAGVTVAESVLNIPVKEYGDRQILTDELNSLVRANGALKNRLLFKPINEQGGLSLRTVEGGQDITLEIDNGNPEVNVVSRLGFGAGTEADGERATTDISLNDLANVGQELNEGDIIRFSGVKPNGERFDGQYTFSGDDKVENLFEIVGDVYGGLAENGVGLDSETGQIILTDEGGDGIVGFDITFSLLDSGQESGIFGDDPPFEFSTNTQVFDEKGNSHSMTMTFTKSVVANKWNWVATVDGLTPEGGNNGTVKFNDDGTLRLFKASDDSPLRFTPGDGTPQLSIEIDASSTDRLGGLTQFVASSSAAIREQDGRAAGSLVAVTIESDGNIVGLFSNGTAENLGRVTLGTFGNTDGLKRQGDNRFTQTQASGQAVIGAAGSTIQGSIRSGSIELSNVDLAQEFTNMIVTQRGFQASARSITSSDELLTEVVNLKR